jgi:hypothetical protein
MSEIPFDQMMQLMNVNAQRVRSLVRDVSDEQARWKPDAGSWSVLEVVSHLYDEEREDFRVRLDVILHRPDDAWPPIDPEGWVTARRYNEGDPATVLDGFLREREASLAWLCSLEEPDWEKAYKAPFGSIRAGDMFAAWVAHDLLHLRQLVELHWAYLNRQMTGYSTRYAGEW